jgi:hypothetical protein
MRCASCFKSIFNAAACFAALTSMFNAGFAMSQPRGQSILVYPSVTQLAAEGAARDMSEFGAEITRKNLNTQPTIKVPIGYKFTVRVNRDMLFDAPYQPIPANDVPISPGGLKHRAAFPTTAMKSRRLENPNEF